MRGPSFDPMSPSTTQILTEAGTSAAEETLVGNAGRVREERSDALGRGVMLGRYIVLDTLGRGGMGIVYAAYDPELDRKVALKLLLPGRDRGVSARLRLQREAQAIARLSHPNVVAVHVVGAVGDQVFIAMEFVDGTDLSRWLAEQPRALAERLDRFLQAGAGLAAAHAAELVHRDFKPENVLLGRDGRARVVDFGLVRKDDTASLSGSAIDELPEEISQRRASMSRDLQLTDAGSMVGTPAYMSPEQFLGQSGDARSDQFSFCVSLYEALYGERPFGGENAAELSHAVCRGELRPPPSQHEVPGRLRRVLLRGLAVDPQARHPSMEALLAALRNASAPRRGRWLAAGGGLLLLGAGGGGALWAITAQERACARATDRAALVWNAERQAELRQRFEETERSYAADTWQRVQVHIDVHLGEWTALQREVCEANQGLDPVVAAEDPRQRCLDERLDEVGELLAVLDDADGRTVMQAVPLAHGLGALGDCAEVDPGTLSPSPSEPALREQVDELRAEIRRMDLQISAGITTREPARLEALAERAEALAYAPLLAEVSSLRADFASEQGDFDGAVALDELAFETALASRHDLGAFRAATDMAFLHGVRRREPEEAHRWARRAEAMRQRMGSNARHRMQLLSNWAAVYALAGDDEHAQALYEEALALVRELDEPLGLATVLNNVGAFHAEARRLEQAKPYLEEAVLRQEELLGPDHPSTLRTRTNLGVIAMMAGRNAEGRALLEAVLPRQEAALGPDHPEIAVTLEGLSSALLRAGELDAAEAMRRRVLEIRLKSHGPRSRPVLAAKANVSGFLVVAGRHAEAYAMATELLRELDLAGDADPRVRVQILEILAMSALSIERAEDGLRHAEEALAVCRASTCLEANELGLLQVLGRAKLDLGDRAGARASFEEVLRRPRPAFHPWIATQARFGLARATLEEDREAALAIARRAIAEAAVDDAETQATVRDIEAWLREHS
jgi:tetratricopeptide (TPR) repeat protein/predicted Ser/Thr protein kinase